MQSGYISQAAKHFAAVVEDSSADASMKAMNAALQASAEGDWTTAANALRDVLLIDPENYVVRVFDCVYGDIRLTALPQAVNDLAVVLLCQGRLQEVS